MAAWEEFAAKLHAFIKNRDFDSVRDLLDPVFDLDSVRGIELNFNGTDPVNLAIDYKDETIACYLVEKGFSIDKLYQWPESKANLWSNHDDGSGKCPWEYDASDNAADKHLVKVKLLIDSIKQGRHPGNTLLSPSPPAITQDRSKGRKGRKTKPMAMVYSTDRSAADIARDTVSKLGANISTKNKNTLLHNCVENGSSFVYVFASYGVPINVQNQDGDTALHLAVRKQRYPIVESLLQLGADLYIKNKLGQTPLDEAEGNIKTLVEAFEPGLVAAVCKGNSRLVAKLMTSLWCCVTSIVKENRTIIELAEVKQREVPAVSDCLRVLLENSKTSELTHAVLSEDITSVKQILHTEKGWSINARFRDRYGKSLLACAIERNNLPLVQILLKHGAKVCQMRLKETEESSKTQPLFHTCIRHDCPIEIAREIYNCLDPEERHEKDTNGNTPILRVVQEGMPSSWLLWLLRENSGYNLTDRNKDGFTAREVASYLGRNDLVETIDKFVVDQLGKVFLFHLPVTFYGEGNTNVIDTETGQTILQLALQNRNTEQDRKVLQRYKKIENRGIALFEAAALGKIDDVEKLNDAPYRDKNGYTALTRAIVFGQVPVAKRLYQDRPALAYIPDNCNRYPLHYAYSLPEEQGQPFVRLLLERNPDDLERRFDKDGRIPAEYRDLRDSEEILQMLYNARTVNAYGEKEAFLFNLMHQDNLERET